ncbi:ComF family protein [Aquabacterium sp. OR-4]|uniref:ComF family protein n=1 Tax=Aquabacterium sp. OR-4 TaxID=2978127 RepID=UPI0021B22FDF|nr:phosphoribosyltransferase family protein [Aquabacterium sp. OR-4]MDT7834440.1 phosphoribosyltransferase family protein [Aquabacterium sp. OR-4]
MSTPADRPAKTLRELWRGLAGAMPGPCALCGSWAPGALCAPCRLRFAAATPRCLRCALAVVQAGACGACLARPPAVAATVAAVDYGFPWDRLIGAFKFQQQPEWAPAFSGLIDAALRRHPAAPPADVVLPVPLAPARLAERGYNQAWQLARHLAARRGLPAHAGWLLRLRDTPHQVGASRTQRLHNLRAAMWVTPDGAAHLAGRHVALVDDVLTTGATAEAAAQALLTAGAASVQLWVLARTPAPER